MSRILDLLGRPQILRRADAHVGPHDRAHNEQGVAHIGASVTHVGVGDLGDRLAASVLGHGQEVRQHLSGMPLVGEAVPDRNVGVLSEFFNVLLASTAVFDAVIETREHSGGVRDGLLVAQLGAAGIQVGDAGALVIGTDLEGAPGAG